MLATCQSGFEGSLANELAAAGCPARAQGPGWVQVREPAGELPDLAFPHLLLPSPGEIHGTTVNAQAQRVLEYFAESLRGERIEAAWPNLWQSAAGTDGLSRRASAVRREFLALLQRKLPRVAKLSAVETPVRLGPSRGLFVVFIDFERLVLTRTAVAGGQRRMADDPAAPSRSYLKLEEAYGVAGAEPQPGESVVDLGAAPGGWSYSAAQRGARVVAVDNGPLKAGALDHPGISHRREDAFRFQPESGASFDWLLCDLVEEPHHVLRDLVTPWLERRWCRRFVVNLKFGRVDPVALLAELRAPASPLHRLAEGVRIRHLFHDREEFTVVGTVRS